MQVALQVNNSTSDQSPTTTTEQTNSIQQTGSGEGLGAPAQPTTTSAAEQQQLMDFLRSESAGQVQDVSGSQPSTARLFAQLGIGVAVVALIVVIAIFCQQQLNKLYAPVKPKRSTGRSKRVQ